MKRTPFFLVHVFLGLLLVPSQGAATGQDFSHSTVYDDISDTCLTDSTIRCANDNGPQVEIYDDTIFMLWKREYESCDPDSPATFCLTRGRPNWDPPYLVGLDTTSILFSTREIDSGTWSTPLEVRSKRTTDKGYSLCIDSSGVAHIFYSDTSGTGTAIYYRRYENSALSASVRINAPIQNNNSAGKPSVAYHNGRLHLAWQNWAPVLETVTEDAMYELDTLYAKFACAESSAVYYAPLADDFTIGGPLDTLGYRVTGAETTAAQTALGIGLLAHTGFGAKIAVSPDSMLHIVWEDDRFLANGSCPSCPPYSNFANVGGDELFHRSVVLETGPPGDWDWTNEVLVSPFGDAFIGYVAECETTVTIEENPPGVFDTSMAFDSVAVAAPLSDWCPSASTADAVASTGAELFIDTKGTLHIVWKDRIGTAGPQKTSSIFYRALPAGTDKWIPRLYAYPDTVYQSADANLRDPRIAVGRTGIVNVVFSSGEYYSCNDHEPWLECQTMPCITCACPQWGTLDRRPNLRRHSGRDLIFNTSNGVRNFHSEDAQRLTFTECASTSPQIRLASDGSAQLIWAEAKGTPFDSTHDNMQILYKPANQGSYPCFDPDTDSAFAFFSFVDQDTSEAPDSIVFDLNGLTHMSVVGSLVVFDDLRQPVPNLHPDSIVLELSLSRWGTGFGQHACISNDSVATYQPLHATNASGVTAVAFNRLGGCGDFQAALTVCGDTVAFLDTTYKSVDLNGDGTLNFFDTFLYLPMLHTSTGFCGDFNYDGEVNFQDTFIYIPALAANQSCDDAVPLTEGTFYKGSNSTAIVEMEATVDGRIDISGKAVRSMIGGLVRFSADWESIVEIEELIDGPVDVFSYGANGIGEIAFALLNHKKQDFSGPILSVGFKERNLDNLSFEVYLIDETGGVNLVPSRRKSGESLESIPTRIAFECCAPNPTVNTSVIRLGLPTQQHVLIETFNISGRKVRTIRDSVLGAGHHAIEWNGQDDIGRSVGPGVYFVRMQAGSTRLVNKLVRVK